ncbi:MAG: hypothetical protein ABJA84_09535 [Polaromonas sp.]
MLLVHFDKSDAARLADSLARESLAIARVISGVGHRDFGRFLRLVLPVCACRHARRHHFALNAQVLAALKDADRRRRLEEAGFSIVGTSPDAAKRMIAGENIKWKKVVTATGFKGD